MQTKFQCQLPEFIKVPKRTPGKVREYMFTFYFRGIYFPGTDAQVSDYHEKTFSYSKPVKYSRVYRDFLKWLKISDYISCDYVVVERIVYDVLFHRQSDILYSTSYFDANKFCPF